MGLSLSARGPTVSSVSRGPTLLLAFMATLLLLVALLLTGQGASVPAWLPPTVLVAAVVLGALSVFGAWHRPTYSADGSDAGPTKSASHSMAGRSARQSDRTFASDARVPSDGPAA